MTIDKLIEALQALSARGYGGELAHTLGFSGYDVTPVPVNYAGPHWLYNDKIGVWGS